MGKLKISRIEVRKLFGVYNYDLQYASNEVTFDNLMILYGDNGTGKSTILRMINYLLSNKERNGHKSELANIAFESFLISFTDGSYIKAFRENDEFHWLGKYSISYSIKGQTDTFTLRAERDDEKWAIGTRYSPAEKNIFCCWIYLRMKIFFSFQIVEKKLMGWIILPLKKLRPLIAE